MISVHEHSTSSRTVAKFEKVSYEVFKQDVLATLNSRVNIGLFYAMNSKYLGTDENMFTVTDDAFDALVRKLYDDIQLPYRATRGSAGYDIFASYDFNIPAGSAVVIPTGLRCNIADGWVLQLYVRSGQGFKYGVHLENTVGIIDSDYYMNMDNEGHIKLKLRIPEYSQQLEVKKNTGIAQGLFIPFGLVFGDHADRERSGGFGSTSK